MPQCGARWGPIRSKCAFCGIVAALFVSSLCISPSWGQSTTQGVVGGMVAGPGGAALADAEVDLTSADTGHIYQSRTDAQGNFRFLGLPPGGCRRMGHAEWFRSPAHPARSGRSRPLHPASRESHHRSRGRNRRSPRARRYPRPELARAFHQRRRNLDRRSALEQPPLDLLRATHTRRRAGPGGIRAAELPRHQRPAQQQYRRWRRQQPGLLL